MTDKQGSQKQSSTIIRVACVVAWMVAVWLVCRGEAARLSDRPVDQPLWVAAVTNLDLDTSLFVPLLLAAPFVWFKSLRNPTGTLDVSEPKTSLANALVLSVLVGWVAFAMATRVYETRLDAPRKGPAFGELPPAYHDEYSYLFQAHTFLAGRTAFEPVGPPGLLDQMHVLNDGKYASRYFPATGVWMAPFVSRGTPYLGHHVANAIIAALLCFAACRIAGSAAGAITGLLIAFAPGMAVFSNLLLAHHPGLVGLSLFLVAFLEARRRYAMAWGLIAGIGLTFAMLARPMTAAGFALPFGLWLLLVLVRRADDRRKYMKLATGLGVPIVCGFVALAAYNRSITGDFFTTPYSVYTNIYTPNHVYGFNNVERGNAKNAAKRIAKYDGWAVNLTPTVAVQNAQARLVASFQWTLGLIPNAMLATFALIAWPRLRFESRLILASIVSLHVAHIPYWFDGIMHYHYVFETGVLWCLLGGIVVADLMRGMQLRVLSKPVIWIGLCVVAATVSAWTNPPNVFVAEANLFAGSRVQTELRGIAFSRLKYFRFRSRIDALERPALVLVEHDPADIHIEYVSNIPPVSSAARSHVDAAVLVGHKAAFFDAPNREDLFRDRTVWVYSASDDTLSQVGR